MKKLIKLTESDLVSIIQKIINEQEKPRIVMGVNFGKYDVSKANREGLTPYYFDFKIDGDYKLVEVKNYNANLDTKRIFLLKPDEAEKTKEHVNIINNLVSKKLEQIKLYKDLIVSVLAEKIMD